eukprot:1188067-Prorocentrum_minimum.AAC.2
MCGYHVSVPRALLSARGVYRGSTEGLQGVYRGSLGHSHAIENPHPPFCLRRRPVLVSPPSVPPFRAPLRLGLVGQIGRIEVRWGPRGVRRGGEGGRAGGRGRGRRRGRGRQLSQVEGGGGAQGLEDPVDGGPPLVTSPILVTPTPTPAPAPNARSTLQPGRTESSRSSESRRSTAAVRPRAVDQRAKRSQMSVPPPTKSGPSPARTEHTNIC